MARRKQSRSTPQERPLDAFDVDKFEVAHQVAGIRTAALDHPGLGGGPTNASRVAMINTGGGLRFTVALDRGGDIVEAAWNQHSLTYLSPNGYKPPSPAYHRDNDWLIGWPAGLVTTCGPQYVGHGRQEDGQHVSLHGHHSNAPAEVEMLLNPDPHHGRSEMLLSMVIRDTAMFGPNIEVRRQIQCQMGRNDVRIYDQVTNRGNQRVAHNWLYHCNFGYPLLNEGTRFIYQGPASYWRMPPDPGKQPTAAAMNRLKTATGPIEAHAGWGEHGLIVEPTADRDGMAHVGVINGKLGLGVELCYKLEDLPRLANWQHFGPRGSYVTGLEPFYGSLFGKDVDPYPDAATHLEPGACRRYQLLLRVHSDAAALREFRQHDGKVTDAR